MGEGYESAANTIREHTQKTKINLKSKQDIERSLSLIVPKVQFKVYNCPDQGIFKEEKHFGKIVLVVDRKNVVIVPPKYYGDEPDLSFALTLMGEGYKKAIKIIQERIENTKIVVQLQRNCTIIWQSTKKKLDYILVEISPDNKVIEPPKFIRVPKE
uniref:Uncharacterized protein n=1 Tax=Hirudo nipponia TaxID=42736 RepID=A0AAF0YZX9_HIRNI|nr:hypothetical protein [Hirudo nipponia]